MESYSRRHNLRFEGVPTSKTETNIQCRNDAYDIMKQEFGITDAEERIVIEKCHRDSKYPKQDPPSILVRFLSLCDRQEIWEKRDRVNRNRSNRIFVNEDFPQEVEKKRAFLRPYLKAAYASKRRATLAGDTLIVESLKYTVDTLHTLPDDIKPEKVAVKTNGQVTSFYRSDAFLSNFHPSKFEIKGKSFSSVEQFYMCRKAEKFGNNAARNRIMSSDNPAEINFLAKQIQNFKQSEWNDVAHSVMSEGIDAKFDQNPKLKALLLNTGDTTLVEASPRDKIWGVGLHMNDPKIFDPNSWTGQNKLDKILMACRERLR